jgi:hypothetical protein
MYYPRFNEVQRYREMTTVFGGYNHQISCQEGQFYDMQNMSSQYFPVLSPRPNRMISNQFDNPQAILNKHDYLWVLDNGLMSGYDNVFISGFEKLKLSKETPKTLVKMGAYVIIMPDKVWWNTAEDSSIFDKAFGNIENVWENKGDSVSFDLCDERGAKVNAYDAKYYEDNPDKLVDGAYMKGVNSAGKTTLKIYSQATGIWMTVASTYVSISCVGIGEGFEKGDGITVSTKSEIAKDLFVNEAKDGWYSISTYIVDKTNDSITIPGIIQVSGSSSLAWKVERKMPDMAFITECNNRLWGCSKDGREIYCSKLGDFKNWNCFRGISTDSWAATLGSDGVFTGATTFLGYPIFFKEDSIIKISVSGTGGHALKETKCRGVQKGSENSIAILNETLYYKSTLGICGYNGSLPYSVSDDLGNERYYDAVAGAVGDRYYVSMRDAKGKYGLFVFDIKNGIWCKEDDTKALMFCRCGDELFYIDADKTLKSVGGGKIYGFKSKAEGAFGWYAESGNIGYMSPDNKYVGRFNIRLTLEFGTNVDLYLQYDSSGEWKHVLNMSGKGTRTYSVPVIPRRCDHFKYKIVGRGGCKIHSITKSMEEGSDT